MRALIQRVKQASVNIDEECYAAIQQGLVVLLGVEKRDTDEHLEWLTNKISGLRIFRDEQDKMNLSLKDINGEVLIISQFTLHASTKKGYRPSFTNSAPPEQAKKLYEAFIDKMQKQLKKTVRTGVFGADMDVNLINQGPVTILIDSFNRE